VPVERERGHHVLEIPKAFSSCKNTLHYHWPEIRSRVAHAASKVEGRTAKRHGYGLFNVFHPTVFIKLGDFAAVLCVQSGQGEFDGPNHARMRMGTVD